MLVVQDRLKKNLKNQRRIEIGKQFYSQYIQTLFPNFLFRIFTCWTIDGMQHHFSKKTGYVGIKLPFSWTHKTKNICKNQNLHPHLSRVTLAGLLWDTLHIIFSKYWYAISMSSVKTIGILANFYLTSSI